MRKSFIIGVTIIAAVVLSSSTLAQAASCQEKCTAGCGGKGAFCFNHCSASCAQTGRPAGKGAY
jgi:hypothetical protein